MFKMIWFRGFGDDPIESHSFGSNGDDHLGTHCGWTMSALGCWCGISGATKTSSQKRGRNCSQHLIRHLCSIIIHTSGILRIYGIKIPGEKWLPRLGEPQSQGRSPTLAAAAWPWQVPSASQSERARLVFCTLGASWSHKRGPLVKDPIWKIWLKNDLNSPQVKMIIWHDKKAFG